MPRRAPHHALTLLAALAASLAACGPEPPEDLEQGPDPADDGEVVIEYDPVLSQPVNALLERWAIERPDERVSATPRASTSIAFNADAGISDADVYILSVQTDLPDGDNAPISTRPWISDPLVFLTAAGEDRTPDEILLGEDRVAIALEATPLGQFTRFGLRKLERWDVVTSRLLRFPDAGGVIESVRAGESALGVVYASDFAAAPDGLEGRGELIVSDSSRRDYLLVTATADGVELARWLASDASREAAAAFGYRRATPSGTPEIDPGDAQE